MNETLAYELIDDPRPVIGLIVLQADETIESDMHAMFSPDTVRLHISRIPSGATLTPDSIQQMALDLPRAAGLFPQTAYFDAVGYACTSGTTLIGASRVEELTQTSCRTKAVTNPLTAAIEAMRALGTVRIGIVSPYIASVSEPLIEAFQAASLDVAGTLSFGESIESRVALISPQTLKQAAEKIVHGNTVDAIFLSCTNLKTLELIEGLEADLGVPVLSSNLCLAWHMAKLTGAPITGPGQLIKSLNRRA